jgi:dipeptidyl aminopeptidase/acylaminoacyl peptidase
MNRRPRLVLAVSATVVVLGAAAAYCVTAVLDYQTRSSMTTAAQTTGLGGNGSDERVVFRNTAPDAAYGHIASVAAEDTDGDRPVTDVPCERVFTARQTTICLRIDRGILTTFSANLLDQQGTVTRSWPLPGLPSRARVSPDGELVAFTSFVTGEAYATIGFSTATQISNVDGTDYGNLETFALWIDGEQVTAADRNFWGVTFTADDEVFYATAATGGQTWLVRGDLAARTLTAVHPNVECPSVSPDGTRIAFKKNVSTTATADWRVAVLDLATDRETVMPDPRNIDDQVEWLDDSTLLYGVPRSDVVGDSDVWAIAADASGEPTLFIEHAASPAVVRP